jgi:hypothetical protein
MTNEQARKVFDAAVEAAKLSGDADRLARAELLREYFTNSAFRRAMTDHVFALTQAR